MKPIPKLFALLTATLLLPTGCGRSLDPSHKHGAAQSQGMSDDDDVAADLKALTLPALLKGQQASAVTSDLNLPTRGTNGTTIAWSTSGSAIKTNGAVDRPSFSEGDQTIDLNARITRGFAAMDKQFIFTVLATPATDQDAVFIDETTLALLSFLNGQDPNSITANLSLPTTGANNTTLTWSSSQPNALTNLGAVTRPTYGAGNAGITMTVTISRGSASATEAFQFTVLQMPLNDADALAADEAALTPDKILNGQTATAVTSTLYLPNVGTVDGSSIYWTSSPSYVFSGGYVIRPAFESGDATVTLTAHCSHGMATDTKSFTVTVLKTPQTDYDAAGDDYVALTYKSILNGQDRNTVTGNLNLAAAGGNGSTITWVSDDPSISPAGTVTRPSTTGGRNVTLTATISKGTVSFTGYFFVTVLPCMTTDKASVATDKTSLVASSFLNGQGANTITGDLLLPILGSNGTTVTWSSDTPATITNSGKVYRPATAASDGAVKLTATITKGTVSDAKSFNLTVLKVPASVSQAVASDKAALTAAVILNGQTVTAVTSDLNLPSSGAIEGSRISWSTSNFTILSWTGLVGRPDFYTGDATVTLTATITNGAASDTKTFTVTVLKLPETDSDDVSAEYNALTDASILNGQEIDAVTSNLNLPNKGLDGTVVTWISSDSSVSTAGAVTRPSFASGDRYALLSAKITKGTSSASKYIFVTVTKLAATDADAVTIDRRSLNATSFLNGQLPTAVVADLTLPTQGTSGTTISWASDNLDMITVAGKVYRSPVDTYVTLTATITKGNASATKSFSVKVLKQPGTDSQIVALDAAALKVTTIMNGQAASAVVANLNLPQEGLTGSVITWTSTNTSAVAITGLVTLPSASAGNAAVTLTATLTKGGQSLTKSFSLTVLSLTNALQADLQLLQEVPPFNDPAGMNNITEDLYLPTTSASGSILTWTSSDPAVLAADGTVHRPAAGGSNALVTLNVTVTNRGASATAAFNLTVVVANAQ